MKSKLGIVLFVVCIISFFLYEKKGSNNTTDKEVLFRGVVLSTPDNLPINNVEVGIAGFNASTLTNVDGEYLIMVKPSQELVFKHKDYKSQVVKFDDAKEVKLEPANK